MFGCDINNLALVIIFIISKSFGFCSRLTEHRIPAHRKAVNRKVQQDNFAMRIMMLTTTLFIALFASAQNDTVFEQRVQRILNEYTKDFKGFIGKQKLSAVPKRLFVEPGLQGGIDEVHIWGDTTFIYTSVVQDSADTSSTRKQLMQLDKQLQNALGNQFSRQEVQLSFSEEQEVPLTFKSTFIEVFVMVAKFKENKYMTLLGFKGRSHKTKDVSKLRAHNSSFASAGGDKQIISDSNTLHLLFQQTKRR